MENAPQFEREKYLWLKSQLQIDFLEMDEEFKKIPFLVQEAAEYAALAAEQRDTCKELRDEVIAMEAAKLRATNVNGKTPSEAAIDKEVILQPKVIEKLTAYAECRLDAALWSTIVDGFRSKDYALRSGAQLMQMGFITTESLLTKRREEMRRVKV